MSNRWSCSIISIRRCAAAFDEAITKALPQGAEIDRRLLYLEFRLALNRKVKPWENVPNSAVDAD